MIQLVLILIMRARLGSSSSSSSNSSWSQLGVPGRDSASSAINSQPPLLLHLLRKCLTWIQPSEFLTEWRPPVSQIGRRHETGWRMRRLLGIQQRWGGGDQIFSIFDIFLRFQTSWTSRLRRSFTPTWRMEPSCVGWLASWQRERFSRKSLTGESCQISCQFEPLFTGQTTSQPWRKRI